MVLDQDDIRASVAAGVITEAQAVQLVALSEERQGYRSTGTGLNEPFELFRGFNEIFVVVGLSILFLGWTLLAGVSMAATGTGGGVLMPLIGAGALWALAEYFTSKRRMVAPSIALVGMFAAMVFAVALSVGWDLGLSFSGRFAFGFALSTLALAAHYAWFRVPITTALMALGTFAALASWLLATGNAFPEPIEVFQLSNEGPFGWLTIIIGLCCFGIAMAIDMTDPHRVTRRAGSAFWLHVVAAPAIVNTTAITLIEAKGGSNWTLLGLFLCAMALIAIIIDRRSFLVAATGYLTVLVSVIFDGDFAWAILLLGVALVLLGAQWERIRGAILRSLPDFPGKSRLPPYVKETS